MSVRAVVLDIGGVLERTPPTGHRRGWERRLGLARDELDPRMATLDDELAAWFASLRPRRRTGLAEPDPA